MSPRRSMRLVAVAALALTAWLQARGVSALVGARLAATDVMPHVVAVPAPTVDPPRSADIIIARNPFDSSFDARGRDDFDPNAPPVHGEGDCSDVRVLAIAVTDDPPDSPARSLALLRFGDEVEPRLVGVGGDIVAMDPGTVLVDRDGVRCAARIFRPPTHGVARAPVHPATAATRAGVLSNGSSGFVIDRGLRDALFGSAADWMKSISVRPEKVRNEVVGLRVASIQSGCPVDGLGIHAGDILQSLNGISLSDPQKMAEALGVLTSAPRLVVGILRDGRTMQLDYDFR